MFDFMLMAQRNALTGDRNWGWFYVVGAMVVFGGLLVAARILAGRKGEDDSDDTASGSDEDTSGQEQAVGNAPANDQTSEDENPADDAQ